MSGPTQTEQFWIMITPLLILLLAVLPYAVFVHSKRIAPDMPWWQRAARILTFGRLR